jgi:hypothetical protein
VYLGIYIFHIDYEKIANLQIDIGLLLISFMIVLLGFIVGGYAWLLTLQYSNLRVPLSLSLYSEGISIFAKYLPGKIWVVLGRGEVISRYGGELPSIGLCSLNAQIISIAIGLMLGGFPLLIVGKHLEVNYIFIAIYLFLSLAFFSPIFQKAMSLRLDRFFNKKTKLYNIGPIALIHISIFYVLMWLTWAGAFVVFSSSIGISISLIMGFSFVFAGNVGILALVAPGGIGVREAIIVGYLAIGGVLPDEAIVVSIASRIWFTAGEIMYFFLASILYWLFNKKFGKQVFYTNPE